MTVICALCASKADYYLSKKLLNKYDVKYFRCPNCDLIQTESVFWAKEAYSKAISLLDTGSIGRNLICKRLTIALSYLLDVTPISQCLDYGGGHGIFVRMMRDSGLDYYWHDKYAENIFSGGFTGSSDQRYDLVTSFEVFEHLAVARSDLWELFRPKHKYIFVGTVLHCGQGSEWWYYVAETGQHVIFFSRHTMQYVAKQFGYNVICGAEYSLFINNNNALNGWRKWIVESILSGSRSSYLILTLIDKLRPNYASLTWPDHLRLRDRISRKV